ncbi:hypothetical protein WSS_A32830 [Rhodococcus opacus M213]|uniref:Hydrolase n=1 Tax=Rhodococcus opacus M213 TaxID=1129896 RepID=K8XC39_RHOOP|nr:alpha/beta hydrolase [Rhodococcus opacus]EKT78411.1 hypothetical protein WSS_A32830 [Rhodococcus opacus M213]UOT07350.1 alpha/beta hydrolase [Rhodococcus opacus]
MGYDKDDPPSTGGDPVGTTIEIGGGGALQWDNGEYGVVLAHGAVFDAATWEDQATAIADQGATVVAVEDIAPGVDRGRRRKAPRRRACRRRTGGRKCGRRCDPATCLPAARPP